MQFFLFLFVCLIFFKGLPAAVFSQTDPIKEPETVIFPPSTQEDATSSARHRPEFSIIQREDITRPEEENEKGEVLNLFRQRRVDNLRITNFAAFVVQASVKAGVPANTVILILLVPLLATIVAFIRHIVGLPSMEMLVPITFSVTLLATGLAAGFVLLLTILVGSYCSRFILKRVRIMQLPKMALSMFVMSLFVFVALSTSAIFGLFEVDDLSIFPILIFILLSDKIVALHFERSLKETSQITAITILLGILGFLVLSSSFIQNFILLYPETVFILVGVNILIGRYFGLRLTEYLRFITVHGNK